MRHKLFKNIDNSKPPVFPILLLTELKDRFPQPEVFNHFPEDIGKWVEYNGFRYKDVYDLELHDGTILYYYYPNAYSWNRRCFGKHPVVEDSDVKRVRLSFETKHFPRFSRRGVDRIKHDYEMFSIKD